MKIAFYVRNQFNSIIEEMRKSIPKAAMIGYSISRRLWNPFTNEFNLYGGWILGLIFRNRWRL